MYKIAEKKVYECSYEKAKYGMAGNGFRAYCFVDII